MLPSLLFIQVATPVMADIQIDVSGNGVDSLNSVSVSGTQTTDVMQSNTATVDQSVDSEANTGGNEISDSSGNSQITTGDVSTQTNVAETLNQSTAELPHLENELHITVSENGHGSVNTVHTEVASATRVYISQVAKVENSVNVTSDTGLNSIDDVTGDAKITTGNIANHGSLNTVINTTQLELTPGSWDITIFAKNNGVDTSNIIYLNFLDNLVLWQYNESIIKNDIYAKTNTGHNSILGALGSVVIDTGDIDLSFDVYNGSNENVITDPGKVTVCCEDGEPAPNTGGLPAGDPIPPAAKPNSQSDTTPYFYKPGDVLGAVIDMLPSTGASALQFWIMTVVYLLTFLSGLYLRLRAGRSPNKIAFCSTR